MEYACVGLVNCRNCLVDFSDDVGILTIEYIYIYIYMRVCVCVCVFVCMFYFG
jgi:hypothetical protein